MRRIVLDTETTGLDCRAGDRVIEIGCVEIYDRQRTGRHLHAFLNPERKVSAGAVAIHGLTDDFLSDKPLFAKIAGDFIEFVRDAELVIHNAAFDIDFLDNELSMIGGIKLSDLCPCIVDTLQMAKERRPGRKNNLNALCSEFGIDTSGRQLHGALRDAELLADVWLAMTRGQEILSLDPEKMESEPNVSRPDRVVLKVVLATETELLDHERLLNEIDGESKGKCLWHKGMPAALNL